MEINKIVCGDCIEYLPKLKEDSVDLIINDPPHYGVLKDEWDNQWKSLGEYLGWCRKWAEECYRVLKDTGSMYVWGSVGERSDSTIRLKLLLDECGFVFKDWITWKKQRGMGNRRGWLYTREEILWFVKDNKKFTWNTDNQYSKEKRKSQHFGFKSWKKGHRPLSENYRISNVWTDIPEQTWNWKDIKTQHSTPKPLEALARIIRAHTKEEELVLDCFIGSGSTAVAAKMLSRNYLGYEIDSKYCDIANRRLSEVSLSGQSTCLENRKA
jgi:site-specific DNA-methyltransferase (adenine-specific)